MREVGVGARIHRPAVAVVRRLVEVVAGRRRVVGVRSPTKHIRRVRVDLGSKRKWQQQKARIFGYGEWRKGAPQTYRGARRIEGKREGKGRTL